MGKLPYFIFAAATFQIINTEHWEVQSPILVNGPNGNRITESQSAWFLKGVLHDRIYSAFSDTEIAKQLLNQSNGQKAFMRKYLDVLRKWDQQDQNSIRRGGVSVLRWQNPSWANIQRRRLPTTLDMPERVRQPHRDPVMSDKQTRSRRYSGILSQR